MKQGKVSISFIFILLLAACASNSSFDRKASEVEEIKVSNFQDFGSTNEDYYLFFTEEAEIKEFVKAMNTAKQMAGNVYMSEGDFDILIQFNDESSEEFHLWLPNGEIMRIENTSTIHKLSKSATWKLQSLLPEPY